jgi:hypothetical protein
MNEVLFWLALLYDALLLDDWRARRSLRWRG